MKKNNSRHQSFSFLFTVQIFWITFLAFILPILLVHLFLGPEIWRGMELYRPLSRLHEYFESNRLYSSIRQPWNTYSNVSYFMVGLWILLQKRKSLFSFLFAFSLFLLAYGSAFFHGSLTEWGHFADRMGMYAPLLAVLVAPFLYSFKNQRLLILGVIFLFMASVVFLGWIFTAWYVYPALFLLLLPLLILKCAWKQWLGAFFLFALAFGFQRLDVAKFANLHWLWHFLTALSLTLLYVSIPSYWRYSTYYWKGERIYG
ncbi:MAG: hypothetical protein D6785_10555 [Planctomycetota bacterium]|nr:MAG: hypothetical protein D6785_10555 [Planctomycetota bacterium]